VYYQARIGHVFFRAVEIAHTIRAEEMSVRESILRPANVTGLGPSQLSASVELSADVWM
jgi:hypothetical protein